jgi:diguanylate cyclase (GGDEF)-like protein
MDYEREKKILERRLAALTEEAAKNEAILKNAQVREMELLEAASLQELLRLLVDGLKASYGLEAVTLVVCDPHHEVRHLLISDGARPENISGVHFVDTLSGVSPRVVSFTRPWLGAYAGADHRRIFPGVGNLGSVALMPLLRQQKPVGSLNFGSADAARFTRQHATDFLHHMATIVSFCLENAVNRARLVKSGLTDVLTGSHNRRYLEDRLRGELASAQRTRRPLVCLLLDVDHFKSINDAHGHLAGDRVLREIARRIESQVRASDVAARFGGEEFAVLLPATATELALSLGERIRAAVSRTPVEAGGDPAITVTVSIGIASLIPEPDAKDLDALGEALLAKADTALYRAKSEGRDCVRLSA